MLKINRKSQGTVSWGWDKASPPPPPPKKIKSKEERKKKKRGGNCFYCVFIAHCLLMVIL